MKATNRDVRQVRSGVFASGHAITTPFYNRDASKLELKGLFEDREALTGAAIVIASPFGTGKTFFIEVAGPELGVVDRERALRVPGIGATQLRRARGDVLFLDEADTKSSWPKLDEGLARIGDELSTSGRTALLLGDFALRNPALLGRLPRTVQLTTFEPLNGKFLQGVIQQRLRYYIGEGKQDVDDIIDDDLYAVLVPDGMARVNSFRTVLAFLEQIASDLPHDTATCRITVEMARQAAINDFDRLMNGFEAGVSDIQERFLAELIELMGERYTDGAGLEEGLAAGTMMALGEAAGCRTWRELNEEVIEPFGRNDILLSRGTPHYEDDVFVRYVEPFYPSLQLMLLG